MPQNPTTSTFSSFIGIILLFLVIGFTVFINLDTKKEVEKTAEIEEEIRFEPFDSTDIANFWKLEELRTSLITINQNEKKTYVGIDKVVKIHFNSLENDSIYSRLEKLQQEIIVNYGILAFKNTEYKEIEIEDIGIHSLNNFQTDSITLIEVGTIISHYQIQSINTESIYGDFTHIFLKDGREIILVKAKAKVTEDYQELIENAESLNDSTKIIYPYFI